MADANNCNQRSAATTQDLVVDTLPYCTIQAAADGTWHVLAQLTASDQAAFAAAAPA
jgi:hypothetical protein